MRSSFLAGFVFFCLAGGAVAGPASQYGADAWAVGNAGVQYVFGGSPSVINTNPSLLHELPDQFALSINAYRPDARVKLMERPASADVPITLYESDVGIEGQNLDRPLPTVELPVPRHDNHQDSVTGVVGLYLVRQIVERRLWMGLSVLVPTSGIVGVSTWFPDERDQYFGNTAHFVRFAEWNQSIELALGLCWKQYDWLSVGASAEVALHATAGLDAYVPEATVQDYALANARLDASVALRGIVGITVRPLEWLSASVVWKDRRYNKVSADAYLKLWNYHEAGDVTKPQIVHQRHLLAVDYQPMQLSLAAGAELGAWKFQAALTWQDWSDYLDPHHQRAQDAAVFTPTNPDDPAPDGAPFAFSDTWSLAAAASWAWKEGWVASAAISWQPSPVPAQVGRTNYVDNDILVFSAGHRFPLELLGKKWTIDVGLEFAYMFSATVYKDPALIRDEFADRATTLIGGQPMPEAEGLQTNNPGFPGFSFYGWSLAGAVTVGYLF